MKAMSVLMSAAVAAGVLAASVAPASAIVGPKDFPSWGSSANSHNGDDYCKQGELAVTFKFNRLGAGVGEHGQKVQAAVGTFTIKNVSRRACLVDGGLAIYNHRVPAMVGELDGATQHTGASVETGNMGLLTKNLPLSMTDYRDVALKPGKSTFFQFSWVPGTGEEGSKWARAFALVGGQNSFQALHGNIAIRDMPSGNPMNPLGIRSGTDSWHCPLGWNCLADKQSAPKPPTGPVKPSNPKPTTPCPESGYPVRAS